MIKFTRLRSAVTGVNAGNKVLPFAQISANSNGALLEFMCAQLSAAAKFPPPLCATFKLHRIVRNKTQKRFAPYSVKCGKEVLMCRLVPKRECGWNGYRVCVTSKKRFTN